MPRTNGDGKDASEARVFVEQLDKVFTSGENKEMTARWNYITNITEQNEKDQVSYLFNQFFRTLFKSVLTAGKIIIERF